MNRELSVGSSASVFLILAVSLLHCSSSNTNGSNPDASMAQDAAQNTGTDAMQNTNQDAEGMSAPDAVNADADNTGEDAAMTNPDAAMTNPDASSNPDATSSSRWSPEGPGGSTSLRGVSANGYSGSNPPPKVLVVGAGGTVLQSVQGNGQWASVPGFGAADLDAVYLDVAGNAAVAGAHALYAFTDVPPNLNKAWVMLHPNTPETFLGVVFAVLQSGSYVYAAGNGAVWICQTDDSALPCASSSGMLGPISALAEPDDSGVTLAVGAQGAIVANTAGDVRTFSPQQSGTQQGLNAVWADRSSVNNLGIFVVGDQGTILHSTGDGTWTPETSNTTSALYAVYGLLGVGVVYAVGEGGTILVRSNGAWSPESSPTTSTLRGVSGFTNFSGIHYYAVGDNGTILHRQ
jgi:photosystem II stability/assembly factor-like uncharacterized protein